MAYKREGLAAYAQEFFMRKLHNPFAKFRIFLYFMGLNSVESMTKLGRPRTPAVFGDVSRLGRGERKQLAHSDEIYFAYQKSEPTDGSRVAYRGSTPTAGSFSEDNAGQLAMRWTHFMQPIKVGKHSLDAASSGSQIMSIMDNASAIAWEAILKSVNSRMLSGTRTQAQQADKIWEDLLGLDHVVTANNYYGQVDRSTETDLNPLVITAGTDTDGTVAELGVCDVINDGNSTVTGRAGKSPDGSGCNLHIVNPRELATLRQEAQGTYQIHYDGIPGHAAIGHRKPVIEYGTNWITYDDDVTAGTWYGVRLESWLLEVDSRYNFRVQPFVLKSAVEEGGEHYEWSLVHAKLRLTCREPWLQCKGTGFTAS